MPIWLSLILVVLFLLMNAFFVIAEFSLVRVRKSQIEILVEEGKKGAKRALEMADNVNEYLSACQLGITLASLALGWLGEPAVSQLIEGPLLAIGLPEENIWVSQERKMCCGLGKCGHCRIGDTYVCLDGPVFNYSRSKHLID